MPLKKSNLGIHDASRHLNREINSQLDQIIFDLGIHSIDKADMYAQLSSYCFITALRIASPIQTHFTGTALLKTAA